MCGKSSTKGLGSCTIRRTFSRQPLDSSPQVCVSGRCACYAHALGVTHRGLRLKHPAPVIPDLRATLIAAWRTNNRITVHLIQGLPAALWDIIVPGSRRTIRAVAAHL